MTEKYRNVTETFKLHENGKIRFEFEKFSYPFFVAVDWSLCKCFHLFV
jgi:hypothetical protein